MHLETIKENEINRRLLKEFSRKRVLFLEDDYTLHSSVGNFWRWCVHNKVEHNTLFRIGELPSEYVMEQVLWFDVICFQTTWTYDVSRKLKGLISQMRERKTVLECYIHEPTWFYKPKGVVHDVFVLACNEEDMDDWELDKLRISKAIWEK